MVVNIEFKNESTTESPKESNGRKRIEPVPIQDEKLKKARDELQAKKDKGDKMTVAEQMRLGRLKKYGDNALNKSRATGNHPSKVPTLHQLNQADALPTSYNAQKVIDEMNNGESFIRACEKVNIKPKDFLQIIEEPINSELKRTFYLARILLAEYYLERRERLEQDLKNGRIDPSTYSCLSADYKYLAGKLAPLAYGDKIQLDATVERIDSTPSQTKLEQLNKLLQITDAEYEIKDD